MKDTPPGCPRISAALYYPDAAAAIDCLCRAFGFEVRLKVDGADGRIEHSVLVFGDGLLMVGDDRDDKRAKFPYIRCPANADGANTANLMMYVDDVEAHCARAKAAGATIVREPEIHDYGEDYWA